MHALLTTAGHRHDGGLDLGVEPPIQSGGHRLTPLDRRNVSLRWLAGTVLTGLAGGALLGASILAAVGRQPTFAEQPEFAQPTRRDTASAQDDGPRKGDRLNKTVDIVAAKQTFRTPTTIKVGDREVIRARGFTRVSTTLTLVPTEFADDVPEFNPLKLMADNKNPADAPIDPGPSIDDAEVAFKVLDLPDDPGPGAPVLSPDEVQAQVTEQVRAAIAAGSQPPLPLPPQLLLMRTSRAGLDPLGGLAYGNPTSAVTGSPFSSLEVKMVPENVTSVARFTGTTDLQPGERLAILKHGETIDDVLRANGAGKDQVKAIVAAFSNRRGEPAVAEGRKIKLLLSDPDGAGKVLQIARVSIYNDETPETTIAITDRGSYVQIAHVDPAPVKRARAASSEDEDADTGGMRLFDSLYQTALKQDIPRPVIDDLVRIFANDVDFQRSVVAADRFEAFYTEPDETDQKPDLLYATISVRDETFRYYKFLTPDDGNIDYFDESGRSVRKFLIRKPIAGGVLTSGFGVRLHPVLGYTRPHTGVDWANPVGTPILAAGNGTFLKIERSSSYGNHIEIQHANGYITTYSHMQGFARGISEGQRVRQGQVIGYLGQTGLATGPHLHYEVIVNGNFVDPMRVKLARTREMDGKMLSDFRRERDRINGLLAKAPNALPATSQRAAN